MAECKPYAQKEWDGILEGFRDANLFQSWPYAAARWGDKNLSHLVLRTDGEIVGAAQIILIRLPILRGGLAYVKWGPLWMAHGREANPKVFRELLRSLRQVYAHDRGFLLRISPWEFEGEGLEVIPGEEGFQQNTLATEQTAVLDLNQPMDDLRSSLTRHWRSNLKRAETNELEVVEGFSNDLLTEFEELYRQMKVRKSGAWIPPIHYLPQIQRDLAAGMKVLVAICRHHGEAIAGLVVSAIGERSFAWLAASGDAGRDLRGSYLLQWRIIQRLKSMGVRIYDLGGINEATHPGTTQFKLGLCGKRGLTPKYLGEFEACEAWISRAVVGGTDRFRDAVLRLQQYFEERRHAPSASQNFT